MTKSHCQSQSSDTFPPTALFKWTKEDEDGPLHDR